MSTLSLQLSEIEIPEWFNPEFEDAYRIAYMHGWRRGVADANGEPEEEQCD